jgi:hypothetical protein
LVQLIARIWAKRKRDSLRKGRPQATGIRLQEKKGPDAFLRLAYYPYFRFEFDAEPLADGFPDQFDEREGVF